MSLDIEILIVTSKSLQWSTMEYFYSNHILIHLISDLNSDNLLNL